MFNVVTPRTSTVEVIIPATFAGTLQKQNFTNQEQLMSVTGKRVYLKAMSLYSSDFMPTSPQSPGVALASPLDIMNATVTMSAENDKFMDGNPAVDFINTRANLATTPFNNSGLFLLDDIYNCDWTKCFVSLNAAPLVLPISFLFTFHYGYEPRKFFMLTS